MRLIALICILMVTGCAGPEITSEMKEMHKESIKASVACYKVQSDKLLAEATALEAMGEDKAFAYMTLKTSTEAVLAANGVSIDPCGNTNIWDYLIKVSEAQNKTVQVVFEHFMGMVQTVGQVAAVAWLVDSATGETLTVNGNNNSDIGNTEINTQTQVGQTTGDNTGKVKQATPSESVEEAIEDGFVCTGCSEESFAAGICSCD